MVYNENQLVSETLKDIKAQRDNLVNRLNNVMEYPTLPENKSSETFISAEQVKSLQSYLAYVNKNHDSLPPEILSQVNQNKIFQMIQEQSGPQGLGLSQSSEISEILQSQISKSNADLLQELADGYQVLLESCTRREKILQHRLDRLLKDYGNFDRVLHTLKDPNKELEDIDYEINPVGQDILKPEEIISVAEQIRNIMNWKNHKHGAGPGIRKEGPVDYETPNFNTHDFETAKLNENTVEGTEMRLANKGHNIDVTKLKNSKMWFNNFRDEILQEYITKVHEARHNLDMPFDQMYHKEKALIDNLVKAEKELQDALVAQEAELKKHTGSVENVFDPESIGLLESEDDVRVLLKSYQLKNENSNEDSADALFTSDRIKTNYKGAIEQCMNTLSKGYTEKVKKMIEKHAYLQNKGYCFLTFSHSDEVRKLLIGSGDLRLETQRLDVFLKNDLNHEDFNAGYLKARTISDANILYKRENLKKAQDNLREYEKTFEENMPKSAKLVQMREAAKNAIDQNAFYDRAAFPRSSKDEERLVGKIKEMERKTGADFSPLHHNEQKNVEAHKKAFDTYKSYSFLKAGLKKTKLEDQMTESAADASQFKFPSPDEIAKVYINDTYRSTPLYQEEENTKLGRKFGYSSRDFLESYLGKDMMRENYVNLSDRKMYSFNDEMKRQFPYQALSMVPYWEDVQRITTENTQKYDQLHDSDKHPEVLEEQNNDMKKYFAGETRVSWEDPGEQNPLLEGTFKERMQKYYDNLNKPTPYGPRKWGYGR